MTITREALDKVRETQASKFARENSELDKNEFPYGSGYQEGFAAAVSLLWPVIEAAYERNLDSSPELKQAIAQLKERVK